MASGDFCSPGEGMEVLQQGKGSRLQEVWRIIQSGPFFFFLSN